MEPWMLRWMPKKPPFRGLEDEGAWTLFDPDDFHDESLWLGRPGHLTREDSGLPLVDTLDRMTALMRINPTVDAYVTDRPLRVMPKGLAAAGRFIKERRRLVVSTASAADDPVRTLAHELWHSVEDATEWADGADELRSFAAAVSPVPPPYDHDGEAEAYTFDAWIGRVLRSPAPPAVERLFVRVLCGDFATHA